VKLNGNAITWSSRKQTVVAQSTVESEYIALSEASRQVTWIQQMLQELDVILYKPVTIYEDNQGTIKLAENPLISKRSKHIAVRYHYIREKIEEGTIKLTYCPTKDMVADTLTKALAKPMFKWMAARMGLVNPTKSSQRGEVLNVLNNAVTPAGFSTGFSVHNSASPKPETKEVAEEVCYLCETGFNGYEGMNASYPRVTTRKRKPEDESGTSVHQQARTCGATTVHEQLQYEPQVL
jgi:hypothetical protein